MLAPLLIGAGLGALAVAVLRDWNDSAEKANYHFTQINNTYVQINRVNQGDEVKLLHDECFQHWLDLKVELDNLEAKKRELYFYTKSSGLGQSERTRVHEILQDMKLQSLQTRAMKETAHDRWQSARTRLMSAPARRYRKRLPY